MKKITYWVVFTQLCVFTRLFAQQTIIEKSIPMKMGECMAQKISLVFDKDAAYKVLDIDVPTDGDYTFDMVVNASTLQKENLKIILDNVKANDEVILSKKDVWTLGSMKNVKDNKLGSVFLTKGKHQVKLTFGNSEVPNIDEVSIRKSGTVSEISMNKYVEYIDKLKVNKLPADYLSWKKKKNKGARIASNPKGNYDHELDIAFKYTHYETFYLNQGQVITLNTKNSNGDPVMYLFNSANGVIPPQSWVNDDSNGTVESLISVTIPSSGNYALVIRAYGNINGQNFGSGTCDLWKDGVLYRSSIAVAGTAIQQANIKPNQVVNFFTAKLSSGSDTRIYVSGNTLAPIETQNDDYFGGGGDFSWGFASRIKTTWASQPLPLIQINAYSISSIGTCDVYQNVLNSTITSSFPNLKPDDAIQSAPATGGPGTVGGYNCGSWAGGITDFWFWPDDPFSQWRPSNGDYLTAFDNFYGNTPKRYTGAYTYTRSGANETNASVALWANPNWFNAPFEPGNPTKYTHASVTKPGNDNPHGYDWESKPGRNIRTFHPRDALNDLSPGGYGNIVGYYRYTGVNAARMSADSKDISLEESLEKGLSVMDKVEFDREEKDKLSKYSQKVESKLSDEFDRLLNELENEPINPELEKFSSYRIIYGGGKSYKALSEWCLKQGKSIYPLLISKYSVEKPWMLLLAEDVLANQYSDVLESVKKENLKNPSDEKGTYIVRTSEMNCMRFLKKIIANIETPTSTNSLGQSYPNAMDSQTTINFEVENNSQVSINVYDNKGNLVKTLIDNVNQEAGKHTVTWDGRNNDGVKMPNGIYIYRLVTPAYSDSKRILIK